MEIWLSAHFRYYGLCVNWNVSIFKEEEVIVKEIKYER